MLIGERHKKIIELVNQKKSVRVSELSKLFQVTEETIRRDLEKLESEKLLTRSHGGAIPVANDNGAREIPYSDREIMNIEEKKAIAKEAIKQVEPGDRIILDASTTAWYMARMLPDIPLTVLTNSLKVALELSSKNEITVISTGGILLPRSLSYVGPVAEESLKKYHVNKAFISCKGLHFERGMSESNEQQAQVKQRMIECSDRVYVLLDHSKFGVRAFTHLYDLSKVDQIITDSGVEHEVIVQLQEHSMNVIRV